MHVYWSHTEITAPLRPLDALLFGDGTSTTKGGRYCGTRYAAPTAEATSWVPHRIIVQAHGITLLLRPTHSCCRRPLPTAQRSCAHPVSVCGAPQTRMYQDPAASQQSVRIHTSNRHTITLPYCTYKCTALITAPKATTASPVAPGGSLMLPQNRWQLARSTGPSYPWPTPGLPNCAAVTAPL